MQLGYVRWGDRGLSGEGGRRGGGRDRGAEKLAVQLQPISCQLPMSGTALKAVRVHELKLRLKALPKMAPLHVSSADKHSQKR